MRSLCRKLTFVAAAVVLTAAFSYVPAGAAGGGGGQQEERIFTGATGEAKPDMSGLLAQKASLTASERKIEGQLLQLAKPEMLPPGTTINAKIADMQDKGLLSVEYAKGGEVGKVTANVYIKMAPGAAFSALVPYVEQVVDSDRKYDLVVANVDLAKLEDIASLPGVRGVQLVTPPVCGAGSRMSQGDAMLTANELRDQLGADGAGVKVGVISDGATHYLDSVASGDLPGDVHILSNAAGDEGTAMMEIVHDLAPGAELYFHEAGSSWLEFNQAIQNLVNAGCDVVCDDVSWITQPFFEDGIIADYVTDLLATHNVVYTSSAGNYADSHYQGQYLNDGSDYHDFGSGSGDGYDLYAHLPAGDGIFIVFQWNDPYGASGNDYDLILFNADNYNIVLADSCMPQTGTGNPIEVIDYTNDTGDALDVAISVRASDISVPGNLEVYIYTYGEAYNYSNNIVAADSIFGHAAVPGVLACAAINANPSDSLPDNQVEYFSSRGPVTMLGGVTRQKPDIAGADGVSVTGAGGFPNPFYGTSAASPHIAAVAALLWDLYPDYNADEIRDLITDNAADMGAAGFDTDYGWGKADALTSAQMGVEYTVTFDSQGGSAVAPAMTHHGGKIAAPSPAPTKDGHGFFGWYKEADCINPWNFTADVVTENITLYAKWKLGPYTVTFDSQGGTSVNPATAYYGDLIASPAPAPTRTGHTFEGWYTEADCENAWIFDTNTVTGSITLWAKWTPIVYTVTFNSNGGTPEAATASAEYGTTVSPPDPPPTRDTYTFAGWYKESTCKTAWNFDTGIVTGNMTLYAKWVVHKVSFNPQGGSSVASANVTANTQVPRPADPKRTGYTFAGWFKESSCLNEWVFDTELMPAKSITLYAKWNINYYNVVFDSKGGSDVETKEHIAYNTTFPAPLIPSREHYTFKGWYKDSACKYAWSFSKYKMPAADATGALTLYAKWSAHTFTVSFNSQGGSRVSSKKAAYNSRISAPRSPKRTGYTFAGWHKEPECLNPWVFGTDTIAGKTTLYARWNINHYTVKYDARGGTLSGPASDIVEYKSLLNVPEPPTKPGCVFGGWYTSTRYSKQWSFTSGRVTKSFTLYAKWNESDYKVTFDTRVKKLMVAYQTVPWNGYAVEPAAPEREGYFLEGWYTSKTRFTSSYKWNFATRRVTGSVTLYARWLPAKYKVAFNANGGTLADGAAASVLVDYNALVAKPDDPARTGYFFGGWYTSSRYFTSKYEWNFDTRTVKSNVALYARWVRTLSTPKVTAVATVDDTVSVTCSAVQYATGYRFFYTATPLAPETWIQVDSDTPSVSVNGLEADSMYYFKAQAANEEGGVASAVSSAVTETPGKPASPAAAAATYNKITVTWDAVPRCAGYEVYRATSSRGTYYRKGYIGDVSGPSFDDTSLSTGRTYYYKVKAYRMVGTKKVYGAYSTVVSSKCTLQAPATISAESPSATSLKIIWGSVPGATRYEVWRATADKGVYYRLTTTSYTYRTDSGLVTGQPYYYKVRAYRIVSGRKVYGAFAPVVIATPGMAP